MLIIFDLDDTLIDTSGSITPLQLKRALQAMVEAGLSVDDFEKAYVMLRQIDATCESSSQTLKEFLIRVGADLVFLTIGQKNVYGPIPDDLPIIPLNHAFKILKNLKKSHQLAVVSIGNPDQQRLKMEKAGLDSALFSKIVISTEEDKKSAYVEVLKSLSADPAQTVVCGDRIKRDLTPAKQLGCITIQMEWGRGLCSTGSPSDVDFKIQSLSEIEEIIEKL